VLALLAVATLTYHLSERDEEVGDALLATFGAGRTESAASRTAAKSRYRRLIALTTRRAA